MRTAQPPFQTVSTYPGDAALAALLGACKVRLTPAEVRRLVNDTLMESRSPARLVGRIVSDIDPARVCESDAEKLVSAVLALWNEAAGGETVSTIH